MEIEEKKKTLNQNSIKLIELMSKGYKDPEIAEILSKSIASVRSDIQSLLDTSFSLTRPQLIAWAYKNGILKV